MKRYRAFRNALIASLVLYVATWVAAPIAYMLYMKGQEDIVNLVLLGSIILTDTLLAIILLICTVRARKRLDEHTIAQLTSPDRPTKHMKRKN